MANIRKTVMDIRRYLRLQKDLMKRFNQPGITDTGVIDAAHQKWHVQGKTLHWGLKKVVIHEGPYRGDEATIVCVKEGKDKYVVIVLSTSKEGSP